MAAKPVPLSQVKRNMKHYFDTRTAASLFDEFVGEIYDLKDMTADDFIALRDKLKKGGRTAGLLIRLKKL